MEYESSRYVQIRSVIYGNKKHWRPQRKCFRMLSEILPKIVNKKVLISVGWQRDAPICGEKHRTIVTKLANIGIGWVAQLIAIKWKL